MSLIRRSNANTFPSVFEEFFRPDWFGGMNDMNNRVPAVNIKEKDNGFELELAAPGVKKEDFNIEVDQNVLTISTEQRNEKEETGDDGNYSRREFSYTSFQRSFTLPDTVNSDKIDASYEDGVLKLSIPKKEEALPKPKRMIDIK
ncbi:Hsp20/alpha crystallin family protein [Robertkochia aurantiaca]|uniref:Hsp20/alpha crystallin family protein n=1 Tax=Robertkochia aurantiaca TaxID=2873700 RepID=UPI001CCAB0E0|nr:Hsp20/alpha crystallin family protein [Robertkochia sp. 3YJGBD-33]